MNIIEYRNWTKVVHSSKDFRDENIISFVNIIIRLHVYQSIGKISLLIQCDI